MIVRVVSAFTAFLIGLLAQRPQVNLQGKWGSSTPPA